MVTAGNGHAGVWLAPTQAIAGRSYSCAGWGEPVQHPSLAQIPMGGEYVAPNGTRVVASDRPNGGSPRVQFGGMGQGGGETKPT